MVVDDQTDRSAARAPNTKAGTDCFRVFVCELGAGSGKGSATGGVAAVVEDCTDELPAESETGTEPGTFPEAETSATVGNNTIRLDEARLVELGAAVATFVSLGVAADVVLDAVVASAVVAVNVESKMTSAPAPIVKLVPLGRALVIVTISVPAETTVPPL